MFARHEPAAQVSPLQIIFPADWLESLKHLLKSLKTAEFQTVGALLAAVTFDDIAAGQMLERILYWHSLLKREFYLSKKDWWQQCRVQRKTIDRVKAEIFPLCGVGFTVKFTGKANTTHYRLHEWKFLRRLAQVMGLPMLYLADKLCTKRTERNVQSEPNVVSKTDATLTRDSTSESSTDVVNDSTIVSLRSVELLKKAGVRGQQYATLPEAIIEACIESARNAVKNRRIDSSIFIPYLTGALKKQLQAYKPAATEAPPPNPLPVADEIDGAAEQPGCDEQIHEAVSEKLSELVSVDMTAYQAWSAAHHQLGLQLDRTSYDYVRAAKLVDYEPDTSTFVVKVHSTYARDMLQYRLYRNVARILRDVTGREIAVRFEADAEKEAAAGQRLNRFLAIQPPNNRS